MFIILGGDPGRGAIIQKSLVTYQRFLDDILDDIFLDDILKLDTNNLMIVLIVFIKCLPNMGF